MATMPGTHGRTLSNREIVALAGFALCGAALAFVDAFGVLV